MAPEGAMTLVPWERKCRGMAASCWWGPCRRRSVSAGIAECAESCRPETWTHQCYRQSTSHPLVRGWQIYPWKEDWEMTRTTLEPDTVHWHIMLATGKRRAKWVFILPLYIHLTMALLISNSTVSQPMEVFKKCVAYNEIGESSIWEVICKHLNLLGCWVQSCCLSQEQ